MLKIVSGSFEDLKREMKQASDLKKQEIKSWKKKLKDSKSNTDKRLAIERNIEKEEKFTKIMFVPSKVLPVKVGGIVINYKAYQSFVKKIERLESQISLSGGCLRIDYKTGRYSKGYVEFADLREYFEGFVSLPEAKIIEKD